jgi:transcription initiation factor TFIID subunit 1
LAGGIQEVEYIEQLDLVNQHTTLRHDWSKILLREYQRPKLPLSTARLAWQLQIRYVPETNKANELPGIERQIRTEADLSPSIGKLVLLEFCEEHPPISLTKGMRSKIVNYYRGDRAKCPISAGGGDRPARRKVNVKQQQTTTTGGGGTDGLPKLHRKTTSIMDWVGKVPKKKDRSSETIDVLAEGVTELLHPKVHGPFLASIEEDTVVSCLVTNLFVAPLFRHEPENTDFLMILTPPGGQARAGQRDSMGVILREMPSSLFCVGQTEPRAKVHAPNSADDKALLGKIVSYQIARAISRAQTRDGHGLKFDDLRERVMPSLDIQVTNLRQRLKHVAMYDKNTGIWTPKPIGFEDYHGLEVLGRSLAPEYVATFEAALATRKRLSDLGIELLIEKGANAVLGTGFVMVYLAGQLNATRDFAKKVKKLYENSRASKRITKMQLRLFEKAAEELNSTYKILEQRYEVAKFIYEELQLASWHVTREFIDVHTKGEGNGMMKLTGLGDPSGQGAGFSFLRDTETKQNKHPMGNALNDEIKKITGTEDDLRKLTMKDMAALLRHYGMKENKIKTLKRWDRVHCIRDLSTKAASDGMAADGLYVMHQISPLDFSRW